MNEMNNARRWFDISEIRLTEECAIVHFHCGCEMAYWYGYDLWELFYLMDCHAPAFVIPYGFFTENREAVRK